MKHRVKAQVDMQCIRHNYNRIKQLVGDSTRVMAVVKADAYGHGAVRTAAMLESEGCTDFAVACLSEAEELKQGGIKGNILILGPTDASQAAILDNEEFIQTVDGFDYALQLAKDAKVRVHIKVDTGMSRIGIYCHRDEDIPAAADEIERISKTDGILVEGIFTHFADSDSANRAFTEHQYGVFTSLLDELARRGVQYGTRHCCNSAATVNYPEMHLDMVRAGIILYGLMPSDKVCDSAFMPAMKLTARICAVHRLAKGDCVSYGCTFTADRETRVAVISIGYADGFSRVYSGKPVITVSGKKYSTIGRICMDMCMIELEDDAVCEVGDEAVIFESAEDIEHLAEIMGTVNYEILCSLKHRVTLKYVNL